LGEAQSFGIGRSAVPMFRALRASRRLRGTSLTCWTHRGARVERALIEELRELASAALADL